MNTPSPSVIIINVGTELLSGKVLNSNAHFLSRELDRFSFPVLRHVVVHDTRQDILSALRESRNRADIIIVTGGLGPTFDDITTEVLAEFVGKPLFPRPALRRRYAGLFKKKSIQSAEFMERQIRVPRRAELLGNRRGAAAGLLMRSGRAVIAALPGVPHEMEEMATSELIPKLDRIFLRRPKYEHLTLRLKDAGEITILSRLRKRLFSDPKLRWGIYPECGEVILRVYFLHEHAAYAHAAFQYSLRRLRRYVFSSHDKSLEEVVGTWLAAKGKTLSVAESIAGGWLGKQITEVSGSSRYFLGGVIVYSNELKIKLLHVDHALLLKHGAVSRPVAVALARGVQRLTDSDFGLSTTGIAGPGGATKTKPLGLVHMAAVDRKAVIHRVFRFRGDRDQVRARAVRSALSLLYDMLMRRDAHSRISGH